MRINVRQLEAGGLSEAKSMAFACDLDFSHVVQWGERPFRDPVRVEGEVTSDLGIMTISYTASFCREDTCARCLAPVRVPGTLAFSHTVAEADATEGEPDEETALAEDGVLDLDGLVLADILLSQDRVVLCRPDCPGLCRICGANLNGTICACGAEEEPAPEGEAESPFAALLDFMDDTGK